MVNLESIDCSNGETARVNNLRFIHATADFYASFPRVGVRRVLWDTITE